MSGLLNKLMTLKQEVAQADEEYEQLLADECMDVFVLDEALMECYEVQKRYIRVLEMYLSSMEERDGE